MKKIKWISLFAICIMCFSCTPIKNFQEQIIGEYSRIQNIPPTTITSKNIILDGFIVHEYTIIREGQLHIKRTWLNSNAVDYEDDCEYWFSNDTLIITKLAVELAEVYPPSYGPVYLKKIE